MAVVEQLSKCHCNAHAASKAVHRSNVGKKKNEDKYIVK